MNDPYIPPSTSIGRLEQPVDEAEYDRSQPWISAEAAYNRIVLRTVAGGAKWAARLIDQMDLPEVLGTIAGNDSVAIICQSAEATPRVLIRLQDSHPDAGKAHDFKSALPSRPAPSDAQPKPKTETGSTAPPS